MTPVTGTSSGADAGCFCGLNTQHDPWRASRLAWRIASESPLILDEQASVPQPCSSVVCHKRSCSLPPGAPLM
jgi:hypothetical protein